MLCVAVFLVFLVRQSFTEQIGVKYRCNDSSIDPEVSYSTFTPSLDGVRGRYTAELCTFNDPNRTLLTMHLTFKQDLKVCDPEFRKKRGVMKPGLQHSSNTVDVSGLTNCSHVCYAMDFDLIFSSCYLLTSTLNGVQSYRPHNAYFLVNNNITKEAYDNSTPYVVLFKYDDYFTLSWILGIPAVDYSVTLHKIVNDTGEHLHEDFEVTKNCTLQNDAEWLRCDLAPPYGCYEASLVHGGLWISGVFHQKKFVNYDYLCHLAVAPPTLAPRRAGARVLWACGAALLAALALLAAAALRRQLRLRDYHKRVLDFWFNNRETDTEAAVTRDSRDVLLLYAREGEHGQQAMAALRELIQHSTGGTVYDVFSPEVMALCGPAPHTWVRGLLQRDDVRVLLVQSPATAALYQDHLCEDEGGLRLRSPLLGRRAMYRAPHFGDQLLQAALRQLAETPAAHQAYHKYYLATYESLPTDVLPTLVPYRRYELPGAARALAQHLAAAAPDEPRLAHAARAVHAHVAHARTHPDYLLDEIFIH